MRILRLFASMVVVLILVTPVVAQQQVIYLPVILKGDDMRQDVNKWAILEIGDGSDTLVNMLKGNETGFHLYEWRPQISQPKEGGVFQDSPMAGGRRNVYNVDASVFEKMVFDVNDYDQDSLIIQIQDLLRLLLKVRSYGAVEWQDTPVWIRARSVQESNDRYARIISWSIPELGDPYAQPFAALVMQLAAMEEITLNLERDHWSALPPGQSECVEISNVQSWNYDFDFTALGTGSANAIINGFARHGGSGALYATSAEARIKKSTDGGLTWVNNLTGAPLNAADDLLGIVALANNNLLAYGINGGGVSVIRSTNDGGSWSNVSPASAGKINKIIQIAGTGTVIAVGSHTGQGAAIWRSTDNGGTYSLRASQIQGGTFVTAAAMSNGNILAVHETGITYISSDDGSTWTISGQVSSSLLSPGSVLDIIRAPDTYLYLVANNGIYRSKNNAQSWDRIYGDTVWIPQSLIQAATGKFYSVMINGTSGAFTALWESDDSGLSWRIAFYVHPAAAQVQYVRHAVFELSSAALLVGSGAAATGQIYLTGEPDLAVDMGRAATCENEVYIANRNNLANLTHIFNFDASGPTYTSVFPAGAFPIRLLPTTVAVGDILYMGIEQSVPPDGVFGGAIFDIATPMVSGVTIVWEYSIVASAWSALTVKDNTLSFSTIGVKGVFWKQPSNWVASSVNGITAYWVRARVTALPTGVTVSGPTQQNRDIYAPNRGVVDIGSVLGDIPALSRVILYNQSDKDGPGGSAPDLYSNRVVVGLRSLSNRGSRFTAFINLSNVQNAPGTIVNVGANSSFTPDTTAPTGSRVTYNPGGVEAMATRATISLSPTVARDFYGKFHAYLVGRRTAGVVTDFTVRLQVSTGSGGIVFTSETAQFKTTTAFEVLDFGEIAIPVSSLFRSTDLGDKTDIAIQAAANSGTPDLYLYELAIIPVDEWSIDVVDRVNSSVSDVGSSSGIPKMLDIDSVSDPRIDIKALVRTADSSKFITSEYNPVTGGPAILQSNADQQLWVFAMQANAVGANPVWLAPPEIVHSVQVFKNERYLGPRGSR